ncbi:PREDICTED: translation initiation factor IF-2-like [Chinchilla lanigera]|uniref:translation initiation factor IF-2-like n=1 Tax=Chinchilla lanigera TaxID=34839 RepID=UPI000697F398|nr:PREDICTED: translation initiation factor IF-2-like [Chinchilla lanigera]
MSAAESGATCRGKHPSSRVRDARPPRPAPAPGDAEGIPPRKPGPRVPSPGACGAATSPQASRLPLRNRALRSPAPPPAPCSPETLRSPSLSRGHEGPATRGPPLSAAGPARRSSRHLGGGRAQPRLRASARLAPPRGGARAPQGRKVRRLREPDAASGAHLRCVDSAVRSGSPWGGSYRECEHRLATPGKGRSSQCWRLKLWAVGSPRGGAFPSMAFQEKIQNGVNWRGTLLDKLVKRHSQEKNVVLDYKFAYAVTDTKSKFKETMQQQKHQKLSMNIHLTDTSSTLLDAAQCAWFTSP